MRNENEVCTEFIEVRRSNWNKFRKEIMRLERERFPEPIQESEQEIRRLAQSPTAIFLVLKLQTEIKIVGYLAADRLEKFAHIPGIRSDPHFREGDTVYINSWAVDPDWQGQGFGTLLLRKCLLRAAAKRMKRVTAHMRSEKVKGFGGGVISLGTFENWYETGCSYDYAEFPVEKKAERWTPGCQGMLSVNAIFAGFSAVIVAVAVTPNDASNSLTVSILLAVLAFILFALGAERFADALEARNVYKYVRTMLLYNFGVVLLFVAIGVLLYSRNYQSIYWIPFVATIYPWLRDIRWLLFADQEGYRDYIHGLTRDI